jgi:hypothetical protein
MLTKKGPPHRRRVDEKERTRKGEEERRGKRKKGQFPFLKLMN